MAASATVTQIKFDRGNRWLGIVFLAAYGALYAGMLLAMRRAGNYDVTEPLFVLAVLGIGFSLVAWLMTLRVSPLRYEVVDPPAELKTVVVCLAIVVAFITWGLGWLHRVVPSDPADSVAILAAKLAVFVALPAVLLKVQFGYRWGQLAPVSMPTRHALVMAGMAVLMLVFQSVMGRGLRDLMSAHLPASTLLLGIPLAFVWLAVEAGVVEEFFFRVLLQTRLAAVLRSELAAIVLMSVIFGLAHAPGIYLRTAMTQEAVQHPSVLMAVGYSIVITSVAGFFLGVLWARTRNFALVVVVHAMTDLLPGVMPTLRSFHLLK